MTETKRNFTADRAICDAATAETLYVANVPDGIFVIEVEGDDVFAECEREVDARFIAEARTGWPAALDEIARLQTELADERSMREAITEDFHGVQFDLDGALERGLKRKEALYKIRNATMSMFATEDDMLRFMKRTAREALENGG